MRSFRETHSSTVIDSPMSNSSNDVKPSKAAFSYARAAQGSNVPTPTAVSPQLSSQPTSTVVNDEATTSNGVTSDKKPKPETTTTPAVPVFQAAAPTHSSRSSISSAAGSQTAWLNKGPGVHMPARQPSHVGATATTSSVQFGNFTDSHPKPTPRKSPSVTTAVPAASGGTAPPAAMQGKEVPQFGSIPSNAPALADKSVSFIAPVREPNTDILPLGPYFPL